MESPILEMKPSSVKKPEGAKRPEKTQEQLREALEKRLGTLGSQIEEELKVFEQALEDDAFEDKEGEEPGTGDKRRAEMEARIESATQRAEP